MNSSCNYCRFPSLTSNKLHRPIKLVGSSVITGLSIVSLWIVDSASGYTGHCEYIENTNGLSTKGDASAW